MSEGTYLPNGGQSRSSEMVYDPVSKKWIKKTTGGSSTQEGVTIAESSPKTTPATPGSLSNSSEKSQTDTKSKADKEFIEQEMNTLQADIEVLPSDYTMALKVNDTIYIKGFGSYLSGLYYIDEKKISLNSSSGISISLTCIRTGFGDKMKMPNTNTNANTNTNTNTSNNTANRSTEIEKSVGSFKTGDRVSITGKDAVYSNASDGVKVPEWVKSKTLTVSQVSEDGSRVLLKEINSWTYTKYVKKV